MNFVVLCLRTVIGCGLSDKPGRDAYRYELNTRIEDLTALIEHAVPEGTIDLVVHDWGGAIGFGWAIQNPERIRRLVVLNTAAFPNPKIKTLPKRLGVIRNSFLGQFLVQGLNAFAFWRNDNGGQEEVACLCQARIFGAIRFVDKSNCNLRICTGYTALGR